ncbi:gluconokinase [Arthrobacter sp. SRS-W-1-2016]|uniref:gluconokinase n=1 Tax=Arthrobacter sp. SRS-W-1-2016 TaxID=1930254 RepID=UPI00209A9D5D|nr:gluconokinase [Arthrobacter sp. SRS-W-1-2016]
MSDVETVFVMGVSGVGKTTFGAALASELGTKFIDADDLHPAANKAKMAAGIPLTDADRLPWLDAVGLAASRQPSVVACSALRRRYREHLLTLVPTAVFIHLHVGREDLAERVSARAHEYMPASLLDSQLATLEPLEQDEPGFRIDATMATEDLLQEAAARLAPQRRPSDV